jgi:carbamate kinase
VKLCGGGVAMVRDRASSMGPKVEARLRFARATGASIIANLLDVEPALRGETGTRMAADAQLEVGPGAVR